MSSATGFFIAITKEMNENNCTNISQTILWTKQTKYYEHIQTLFHNMFHRVIPTKSLNHLDTSQTLKTYV